MILKYEGFSVNKIIYIKAALKSCLSCHCADGWCFPSPPPPDFLNIVLYNWVEIRGQKRPLRLYSTIPPTPFLCSFFKFGLYMIVEQSNIPAALYFFEFKRTWQRSFWK